MSIQETRVQSLGREDPTNLGATEPVCAAPPLGLRSGACAPQGEKVRTATREEPRSPPARESPPSNEDPGSQRLQEQQKMNTALCLDLALGVLKRRSKQHPPGPVPVRHEALRALHKGKALGTAGVHGDRARSILKIFGEY